MEAWVMDPMVGAIAVAFDKSDSCVSIYPMII